MVSFEVFGPMVAVLSLLVHFELSFSYTSRGTCTYRVFFTVFYRASIDEDD